MSCFLPIITHISLISLSFSLLFLLFFSFLAAFGGENAYMFKTELFNILCLLYTILFRIWDKYRIKDLEYNLYQDRTYLEFVAETEICV